MSLYIPVASTEFDPKKILKAFKKVRLASFLAPSQPASLALNRLAELPADSRSSAFVTCLQEFACNGTVVEDDESGQVIQLQGDQRTKIRQFLVDSELFSEKEAKEKITIHG